MLQRITEYFQPYATGHSHHDDWLSNQAAVLVPLTRDFAEPSVILTKRSELLNSHRGQVAFPGGKRDQEDHNLLATALRETHEEIGLEADQIEVIARWPSQTTRFNMDVTPFVGLVSPEAELQANPDVLDAVFQVPLSYFLDQSNITTDQFVGADYNLTMPCYIYHGFRIWGFTLGVLVDVLNKALGAGIQLAYPDFSVTAQQVKMNQRQ